MSYQAVAKALAAASSVLITTHLNPDGDGIGAGLALLHALAGRGIPTRFICPSAVASLYAFLPGFAAIEVVADAAAAAAVARADVLISCDAGDLARLGEVAGVARGTLINLDHHASNTRFGDINLVDVRAESSGVVVEKLLRRLKVPLDARLATCLYATIVFDTGRFMHANTTAATFRWTARLLDTGIDAAAINRALTYTRSLHDLQILRLAIDRLRIDEADPRIAGIHLSAADIAAIRAPEDWGDLVEVPRSLAGNQIAFLLREAPDGRSVRVSLRSNPPIEVGGVAVELGGGGHLQAAGCTVPGSLAAVAMDLLPRLRRQLPVAAAAPAR
jgi:phosphoesterase RecJ-like protein